MRDTFDASRPRKPLKGREQTTRGLRDRSSPQAGGGSPVHLKVISGPDLGLDCTIASSLGTIKIGREQDNDLVLTDPTVSRYHAEIEMSAEGYRLKDSSSTNGTLLDGLRIKDVYLPRYCSLQLGLSSIKVVAGGEERADLDEMQSDAIGLWGRSEKMQDIFRLIRKVATSNLTTLITGETGTGKEVVARAIHRLSPRAAAPFVVFDCSATPNELMENELFGHQKGAFTGATTFKKGVFEEAHDGTAFLDEIGELTLQQQPKLLRVLEQHEVKRLGSTQPVKVNVRVIAATNRFLPEETRTGRFREDLFYRVSVIQLHLPPLRERREDIALLAEHFLKESEPRKRFTEAALKQLASQQWPGNVRELRHAVERTALLSRQDLIDVEDISVSASGPSSGVAASDGSLENLEKSAIAKALDECGGNKTRAARKLGIASSTLYEKLKKYGLTG